MRDQVQSPRTELSSGLGLAQIVADREEEIRLARLQAEELDQRIEQLDDRLNGVHREHDQLGEQLRDLQAQLSNMDAQRDELNERIADHAQALESSQVRSDELAEQLRQRDRELATKLDELERLTALRQADAAEADELRGTLARREQEFQQECESCVGRSTSFTAPLSVPSRHMARKEAGWTNSTTRPATSLSRPGRKSECFRLG